jgi:predicted DNA-binding transcriptional regulator YafY
VGYVLRPGFMLPPLMFSTEEIEALVLGTRWVADRSDPRLGQAARNALAKIGAVLPAELRDELDAIPLLVGPSSMAVVDRVDLSLIRQAIRNEQKLDITYRDDKGADSARAIWPFALGFFDSVRIVMAWCELRQDFRHFRTDRIATLAPGPRYPRRRHALLKEWRAIHREAGHSG